MAANESPAVLRIGELSRRIGVSDHVLRAWERRYGLLQPVRSGGGFRLYSEADLRRVQRMQDQLAQGLSAAEAARVAIDAEQKAQTEAADRGKQPSEAGLDGLAGAARTLATALDELDEPAAQAVIDHLLSMLTVETVIRDVLMPYLGELGDRWARGAVSVVQEHFASNVIRGRLAGLARGWGHGHGPRALLACLPAEQHELALLAFGVVLNRNGWRISYLGADTPLDELTKATTAAPPDLIVLAATTPERFDGLTEQLSRLARIAPLAIAGAGANQKTADAIGARLLTEDPVTTAEQMPAAETGV
ncbi:MerR family transcriptional regulator [Kribbella pittospori]|uniref:MerR family transcriptional regulator n=1 Tax=Kribbella pittospori TaxID=722689 RepID=A0A4R0KDJ3_9ACTN|nr:MerR family transcriptional regulator [Kribbella pittospori]TCC57547.1 MerR family transcriptional regulator [Kribbella pittospori]